jgi:hypothetical protein
MNIAAALADYTKQVRDCLAVHAAEGATTQLAEKLIVCKTAGQQFLTALSRHTKRQKIDIAHPDVCGTEEERRRAVDACLDVCALRFIARDVGPVAGMIFATLMLLEATSKHMEPWWQYFKLSERSRGDAEARTALDFINQHQFYLSLCRGMIVVFTPKLLLVPLPCNVVLNING